MQGETGYFACCISVIIGFTGRQYLQGANSRRFRRTLCALPGGPPRCDRWSLPGAPDRRIPAPATFVIPFTSSNGPVTDSSDNEGIMRAYSGSVRNQTAGSVLPRQCVLSCDVLSFISRQESQKKAPGIPVPPFG
jgi:hypothetical protein